MLGTYYSDVYDCIYYTFLVLNPIDNDGNISVDSDSEDEGVVMMVMTVMVVMTVMWW